MRSQQRLQGNQEDEAVRRIQVLHALLELPPERLHITNDWVSVFGQAVRLASQQHASLALLAEPNAVVDALLAYFARHGCAHSKPTYARSRERSREHPREHPRERPRERPRGRELNFRRVLTWAFECRDGGALAALFDFTASTDDTYMLLERQACARGVLAALEASRASGLSGAGARVWTWFMSGVHFVCSRRHAPSFQISPSAWVSPRLEALARQIAARPPLVRSLFSAQSQRTKILRSRFELELDVEMDEMDESPERPNHSAVLL